MMKLDAKIVTKLAKLRTKLPSPANVAHHDSLRRLVEIDRGKRSDSGADDLKPATEKQRRLLTELYDQVQSTKLSEKDFKGVSANCATKLIRRLRRRLTRQQACREQKK